MIVKLGITERKVTPETAGVTGEEGANRAGGGGSTKRDLGDLYASLIAKRDELWNLQKKYEEEPLLQGGLEARGILPPGSASDRSIYIDYSIGIDESRVDKIISLEREWWGVTLTKQKYGEPSTWAAQWVFVVDGTDWRTFMKNLEAARGVELEGTERGYHVGETYPYGYEGEKPTYRGYSYINWRMCVREAEAALYWKEKENKYLLQAAKDTGGSWAFLEVPLIFNTIYFDKQGIWDYGPEKIAAWIINHELCHGIYRTEDDSLLPFDDSIRPLEILAYYIEAGVEYLNRTLAASEARNPNEFLDFTGGYRINRE